MLKNSIQRQVRLGSVARQFSTASLLRNPRAAQLVGLRQPSPLITLRALPPVTHFTRLYSQESEAAVSSRSDEFAAPANVAVTKFSELDSLGVDERLVQALTEGMGYENMTEVQSMAINPALKGKDMVAQAKTGTGKTLAFLVPIFQRILTDMPELKARRPARGTGAKNIRAIILSPTRELAEQIGVEARKLAKHTGVIVQTAVGGTRKREALWKMQDQGCDILVATPGRLNDILSDPSAGVAAPNLQCFVLDEADRMLDVGFADELRSINDMLPDQRESQRQTLLFSATIPSSVVHLAKGMVRPDNFEFVQTIKEDDEPTHHRVPQHLITIKGYENILPTILEIVDKATQETNELPFKAVLFFNSTAMVQFAYQVFQSTDASRKVRSFEIHSRLTQQGRTLAADRFRRSESAMLFSSDVTARGMDFPNVTHVIQIGLPPDRDQYIHRVGRTGRAGNAGQGLLLLSEQEKAEGRVRLPGLPIKPNNTFESALHVPGEDGQAESYFQTVEQAYGRVPKSYFRSAYLSMLGQKAGRYFQAEDVVTLLTSWVKNGLRWEEPPAIPPKIAQMRNISRMPGVRIGHDVDEGSEEGRGGRGGFGNSRGFGNNRSFGNDRGSGGNNRGFGQRSGGRRQDDFSSQFNNARGPSRDFRGGSQGGYGGSRGGRGSSRGGYGDSSF
ncbi:DEAD-domain-containing protein [Xylariaceae sp. FL1019]|nr:DEAD-domain-containing protein [Xylariaceae sp. FL1019]